MTAAVVPRPKYKYKNRIRLRWYAVFKGSFIYVPILAAYVQNQQLHPSFVTELFVYTQTTSFLFEVITGFVADRRSRRFSMLVGALVAAFSMVLFAQADGAVDFRWAALVLGIGQSFMYGADDALLYESFGRALKARLSDVAIKDHYQRESTAVRGWATGAEAFCSVIGGLLVAYGNVSYKSVMLIQASLYCCAALVALTLKDKKPVKAIPIGGMIKTAFRTPRVLAVMLFSAAASGLSLVLVWWTAPFFIEVLHEPSFFALSPAASFNMAWALFLGSVPFWGWLLADWVIKHPVFSLWCFIGLAAMAYGAIMIWPSTFSFWMISLTYLVRSSILSAGSRLLNQLIEDGERATVNSVGRCIGLLFATVIYFTSWQVATVKQSVVWGIGTAGVIIVTLVTTFLLWVLYLGAHRHPQHL